MQNKEFEDNKVIETIELLAGKTFIIRGMSAFQELVKMGSIVKVDYYDQTSSSGEWSGFFVQKYEDMYYLIDFWQEMNMSAKAEWIIHTEDTHIVFDDLNDYEKIKEQRIEE
jgi:hypothetical protein